MRWQYFHVLMLALLCASALRAEHGGAVAVFDQHEGAVQGVAVSPSGKLMATAGADGVCHLLEAATLRPVRKIDRHRHGLRGVAWANDATVVTCSPLDEQAKASVFFWDVTTGAPLHTLPDSALNTSGLVISADGSRLAVQLDGNAVRMYPLKTGGRIGLPPPGSDVCYGVAFSPDGNILSICNGPTIHHLDFSGAQMRLAGRNTAADGSQATAVAWLPDGKHIVSGHSPGDVRICAMGADGVLMSLKGHRGRVGCLAVSADGKRIASAGEDRTVRVWDRATGRPLREFAGHAGSVTGVAFVSEDLVVSSGSDATVRLWSVSGKAAPVPLAGTEAGEPPLDRARRLRSAGRFDEAIAAFAELAAAAEADAGPRGETTLAVLRQWADAQRAAGNYQEAAKLYLRCFQASEPAIRPNTKLAPDDLYQLARTHSRRGDDATAFQGLKTVAQRRLQALGEAHPAVADVHFALGELHQERREWLEGIQHLEACLRIRRRALDRRHEQLAPPLLLLGKCLFEAHQAHQAEAVLAEAVEICRENFGRDDVRTLAAECRLGRLYCDTGRPKEGSPLIYESHRRVASSSAPPSSESVFVREQFAEVMNAAWHWEQARAAADEALHAARRVYGEEDYRLADILGTLAFANLKLNRLEEARQQYEQARTITLRRFGDDGWQSAFAFASTAIAHLSRGDVEQAEADYVRAIELFESSPTGPPTNAYATYQNLASLCRSQQRWDECAEWFGRSARSSRANLYAHVPVLPDDAKFAYATVVMSSMRRPFSDALTLRDRPQMAAASAEWVINLKGFVAEVLAQRSSLARDDSDPATRRLLHELARTRQQLAAASVSVAQQQDPRITESLRRRERELAAQLGAQTRLSFDSDSWTTLDEVRRAMDEETVLVEFLRFRYDPALQGVQGRDQYVAWIIPPSGRGEVQLVVVGSAADVERLVKNYRAEMDDAPRWMAAAGEAAAERRLAPVTAALSTLLVERLPALAAYQRWLISPDGALWMVPWGALKTNDGRYVIEKHEISYLVTSRQLTWPDRGGVAKRPPVIVANPDYDHGVRRELVGAIFTELPGTAKEAQAIVPSLRKFTQHDPLVLEGQHATEQRVKTIVGPQVLMLGTHGYFEELDKDAAAENPAARHPLLRCGLALAGANGSILSRDRQGNDGVLTGLEVTQIDLRGTALVVLSACQTGLGDLQHGEGVSGLRQAFQLAGAQSVVATLWSIPDEETVVLTARMFSELADGHRDAAALQRAQQAVIAERRAAHRAAHPFFWAAFGVTRAGR